jgi:3-dehydro-L-gulonate 2-dehydrogenase
MSNTNQLRLPVAEIESVLTSILLKHGFDAERAQSCATIFANNSVDGVYTHGVNRFPRFVSNLKGGFVKPNEVPTLNHKFNGIEQWNGNLGAGPLNAVFATNRVTELAKEYGIGCLAMANTNHWMRGGTYGWQAAKAGFVFIGWTNTIGNMPAWGAIDAKLGNNPLVLALPYKDEAIVLDMAMSQFSFGAMELKVLKKELLPVAGGYNKKGKLTNKPAEILETFRSLPIGYWKGAGLSLLLDILATILSGGLSTHEVSQSKTEYNVSQVFIAIDIAKLGNHSAISSIIEGIINDYHQSVPIDDTHKITFPGERVLQNRATNLANGVPLMTVVWDEIMGLANE